MGKGNEGKLEKLKDLEEKIKDRIEKESRVDEEKLAGKVASIMTSNGNTIASNVKVFDIDDESVIWEEEAAYVFYCRISGTQFRFDKVQFQPATV